MTLREVDRAKVSLGTEMVELMSKPGREKTAGGRASRAAVDRWVMKERAPGWKTCQLGFRPFRS